MSDNMVEEESLVGEVVLKVIVFVMVQALVYLILSSSSNLFSNKKSTSFEAMRSSSIARIFASISDFPQATDQPFSEEDRQLI